MIHVREGAVRIRPVERAVLRPVLLVASAGYPVEAAAVAAVVAGERAPLAVERQRPRIASALREQLEDVGLGVIAPDGLAEKRHAADARRARAAVHAVEPSIGAPRQAVGERVRVLEPEAGQPHFGLAVGEPVAGRVPIEEQVWRVHDPDTAVAGQDAGGDVQAGDDVLVRLERSIAVLVLEHRDLVGAPHMIRRRRRHAVVAGAEVLVVRGDGESRGKWILQVLHDPQASAIVEVQVDRLADHRFRRDQLHRQPGECLERAKRPIRRRRDLTLHPGGQLVAAVLQVDVDELVDLWRERPRLRPRHVPGRGAQQRRDGDRGQTARRHSPSTHVFYHALVFLISQCGRTLRAIQDANRLQQTDVAVLLWTSRPPGSSVG